MRKKFNEGNYYINKLKEKKNHMIVLIPKEKRIWQITNTLTVRLKLELEENSLTWKRESMKNQW